MELLDQDDAQEIFEECNTTTEGIIEENKETLSNLNLENIKFGSISGTTNKDKSKDLNNYKQSNNNHHIVPVGIIIVLMTIYLGMTNVQKCLVSCVENTPPNTEQVQQHKEELLNYLQKSENLKKSQILERLLEYKDICKDLAIFTKDIEQKQQKKDDGEGEGEEENDDYNRNDILKDNEVNKGNGEEGSSSVEVEESSSSGASGNGEECRKSSRNKHKKSKYSIKTTNTKNGFNKYNKSTKAKYQKNHKKELNLNKKNSTAEPIIYLFALVFIYLLLKAASDINQHYKSQNKSDKRLRRCSLQSYAQTHRPDRRASKELALKQKQQQLKLQQQQRLKSLSRSSSQDQQNYPYNHHLQQQQQQHLMDNSPHITEQQQQIVTTTGSPTIRSKIYYSSNWQLLRQHTTTQSVDNSDILNCARGNAEISSSMMARRCSVPAALSFQRQKLTSSVSPLSIVSDHVNVNNISLSRRTSITSPLSLAMDPNDSLAPESKRRVRMINRH